MSDDSTQQPQIRAAVKPATGAYGSVKPKNEHAYVLDSLALSYENDAKVLREAARILTERDKFREALNGK